LAISGKHFTIPGEFSISLFYVSFFTIHLNSHRLVFL
jgi:hypothetical protein